MDKEDNDSLAKFLMQPNGIIMQSLISAYTLMSDDRVLSIAIDYDELMSSPKETVFHIFSFLEVDNLTIDLENIKKEESDNDAALGVPDTFHKVSSTIQKSIIDPDTMLSKELINNLKAMEFWKS